MTLCEGNKNILFYFLIFLFFIYFIFLFLFFYFLFFFLSFFLGGKMAGEWLKTDNVLNYPQTDRTNFSSDEVHGAYTKTSQNKILLLFST